MRYLANAAWYCDSRLWEKCKKVSQTRLWFLFARVISMPIQSTIVPPQSWTCQDVSGLRKHVGATLLGPIHRLCPTTACFPSQFFREIVISINYNCNKLDSSEISFTRPRWKEDGHSQPICVGYIDSSFHDNIGKNKDEGNGIGIHRGTTDWKFQIHPCNTEWSVRCYRGPRCTRLVTQTNCSRDCTRQVVCKCEKALVRFFF